MSAAVALVGCLYVVSGFSRTVLYVVSGFSRTVSYVVSGFSRTVSAQQYSFEEVASGLKHKDADTRLRAIQILKDADYQEAAGPIGDLLADVDDRVQLAALDAERSLFTLRPVSRKKMVGFVIEQRSTSGSGDVAAEGQLALKARLVPPSVLGGLVIALSDRNPQVRSQAIDLAGLLAPIACPVRPKANRTGCDPVGNALIENINSREAPVRRAAMRTLGRLQYPQAVQALMDQLSYHEKGPDAQAALEGLAGIGHVASVSTLEELLKSANTGVRTLAIEGLARADARDALPALQQMGQSERSAGVLLAMHYASLKLGAPGSTPDHLVAALRNETLKPAAIRYLLDLAPTMAPTLAQWLGDQDPEVRRLIADILGFSGDSTVVPVLAQAARATDPDLVL
ncbi:MAG TPA: HEAT repeat domain-containing protein, partial [Thermomicrobiales bacterium]|nr:HEAT repeat domain-containing protein [Thermomicrobiales bacterium]